MVAKKQGGKGKAKPSSSGKNNTTSRNDDTTSTNTPGKKNSRIDTHCRRRGRKAASDDDDVTFRNILLEQGHLIREMNADGNCLFRSLSDQLYDDRGAKHDIVRSDICSYLSMNREEFMNFLLMEDDDEDVIGIDSYIEKMRDDGQWGGNVEVVAATRCYERDIIVFSSEVADGVLCFSCDAGNGKKDATNDSLMLSYHGNDHYNSVQSTAGAASQRSSRRGVNAVTEEKANNEIHADVETILSKKDKRKSKAPPRSSKNGKSSSTTGKIKQTTERLSNTESNKDEQFIGSFKVLAI